MQEVREASAAVEARLRTELAEKERTNAQLMAEIKVGPLCTRGTAAKVSRM